MDTKRCCNIDKIWYILVGACVTTLYFATVGLLSAAIVNIVEVVVIILGFSLATLYVISYVGEWSGLTTSVVTANVQLTHYQRIEIDPPLADNPSEEQ